MRFTTRLVVTQLAVVAAVVVLCVGVFAAIAVAQVRDAAEESALNIARSVAASPEVRDEVARWSADPGTPAAADLVDGALQRTAADVADRTDALFVVITDDHGIRLAHPNAERLGEVVSTPFAAVLAGDEVVDWEVGTLGRSARAKVPVLPTAGGAPIGEVSVGFEEGSVFDELPLLLLGIGVAAALALALGATAGALLRRHWERVTLGLQPEELVALVQHQSAVVDGVGDGVVALDEAGVVRVASAVARRLLALGDPVGRPLRDLGLPAALLDAVVAGLPSPEVIVGDRVVALDVQPVRHGDRTLGDVIIVTDRTDVTALSQRLDSVSSATGALRVQRHEFANRLHAAAGLIDAGRVGDARAFIDDLRGRGPIAPRVEGVERVDDVFLQALLGAKAEDAARMRVTLRVGDDTLLLGTLVAVEDAAAVLGNLIDNAAVAAARGTAAALVEVTLLSDDDALVVTVADSGAGVEAGADPFTARAATAPGGPDDGRVHGRGIGLPLSRELARRRGGDLWLVDSGSGTPPLGGAVFAARLPRSLRAAASDSTEGDRP